MKKLSLKNLKLEANNMLKPNQLKTILGGYNPYCRDECEADIDCLHSPHGQYCVHWVMPSCGFNTISYCY